MQVQQDLKVARQKRKKILTWAACFFIALPTLVTFLYYLFIAAPIYTSHNKFTVTIEGGEMSSSLDGGVGALLTGSASGSNMQESYIVKEYISSMDMVRLLDDKIKFHQIFYNSQADFFSRPPKEPTIEALTDYYLSNIDIIFDERNAMITLDVDAFSPEVAQKTSEAILTMAEEFVNKRSDRIQKDSLSFAEDFLNEAEEAVLQDTILMSEFRNQNKNFNPTLKATGVLEITANLENQLANTQTDLLTLSNFLRKDNARIKGLEAKIRSLKKQILSQSSRLAAKGGATLADLAQEFEALKLKTEFSVKRYGMALVAYEKVRSTAAKQKKYLVRVVGPTMPEDSLKPNSLFRTINVFFITLVAFIISVLMISALYDHVRG